MQSRAAVLAIVMGTGAVLVLHRAEPTGAANAGAHMFPELLPRMAEMLKQLSATPRDGESLLFGDWQSAFREPVKNPKFVALMDRARREDVVLPLDDPLFAPETAEAGYWHSQFFLSSYGTALFLSAPFVPGRVPIVLVHGINGSPRDFADLAGHLDLSRYQPVYFLYPSGMPLGAAARQLGGRMQEFMERHAVDRFAVIGHSMGGVVAKGVLDQLDVGDDLASWRVLIAISSPFAGIQTAQYAERLPRHPPAWDDLAGSSPFLAKVQQTRFPRKLAFYVFFGARSSRPILAALGNNDGVLTLDATVGSPLIGAARDVFGFYEDHVSILAAPLVFRRLEQVLGAELGG